jgi:hypothetical protein
LPDDPDLRIARKLLAEFYQALESCGEYLGRSGHAAPQSTETLWLDAGRPVIV